MPDTVPALLEPGEFVIKKNAADALGDDILNMLNNADQIFGNEVPSLFELTKSITSQRAGINPPQRQSRSSGRTQGREPQRFSFGGSVDTNDLYGQLGFKTPSADSDYQPAVLPYSYLDERNLFSQARDKLDYSEGVGGFSNTGFEGATGSQARGQRKSLLQGLQQDISSLRQDYRDKFTSGLFEDIRSGVFEPELQGQTSTPWVQYGMTESNYNAWMDETGGDLSMIGQYGGG